MERVSFERIGEGRLQIKGVGSGRSLAAVTSWLKGRREVTKVAPRRHTGIVEVRYRGAVEAAFLRSLEDHLYVSQRAPAPELRVEASHALPGRVRLRLIGATDDEALRLAEWLPSQAGVLRVSASPASRSVVVIFDEAVTGVEALVAAVGASAPAEWPEPSPLPAPGGWRKTAFNSVVLATCLSGAVPPLPLAAVVGLTALPTFRRTFAALRARRANVDLLDTAAVITSLATGQPGTAAFITWLLGVGDLLLERTADRARTALSRLVHLDAPEAWRLDGERLERIDAARLRVGDHIVVDAGRRVAADGTILSGLASIDEKALTGESDPHARGPGDRVLAATVVLEGQIVIAVERVGRDTTAAKIIQILEGAGAKPMTLQRDAERVADRLVLPTLGVAGVAFALTGQVQRMTSVLITDFGTGVRIAVPSSALAAVTLAARRGVIVKGGQYLERLARVDLVVFDKTGTLTEGAQQIVDVTALAPATTAEVLALCAGAEALACHPIAEAVRRHAAAAGIVAGTPELGSVTYAIGRGVGARVKGREVLVGNARWMREQGLDPSPLATAMERHRELHASSLLVAADGRIIGVLGHADRPRRESAGVVRRLQAAGRRRVVLLSGDSPGAVAAVAAAVGADESHAEMLPEDKAEFVRARQREGRVVAMVGDGINDAPALALSDVGISLHGGTDVALETADVVLLEGGLARLGPAFDTADRAMAHVRRGLGIVILPNAIAIVLGALGLLGPPAAALINNGSTIVAALAALAPLLLPPRDEEDVP